MKRIILALLLIGLIILAGCESKETKLKKEAQKTELDQSLVLAKDDCHAREEENDLDFCLAEKAAQIRKTQLQFQRETRLEYPDVVRTACEWANDSQTCYLYATVLLDGAYSYCSETSDVEGCLLLTDENFCNTMNNREECLVNRAFFLQYINKTEALEICRSLPESYHQPSEEDITCADVNSNVTEFDQDPFENRLRLTYILLSMSDFEIDHYQTGR